MKQIDFLLKACELVLHQNRFLIDYIFNSFITIVKQPVSEIGGYRCCNCRKYEYSHKYQNYGNHFLIEGYRDHITVTYCRQCDNDKIKIVKQVVAWPIYEKHQSEDDYCEKDSSQYLVHVACLDELFKAIEKSVE